MFHRGMTSNGKRWAALFGLLLALALPKHVECGYPGGECHVWGPGKKTVCQRYEREPLGFYLIELVAKRNIGFAYSAGQDCR